MVDRKDIRITLSGNLVEKFVGAKKYAEDNARLQLRDNEFASKIIKIHLDSAFKEPETTGETEVKVGFGWAEYYAMTKNKEKHEIRLGKKFSDSDYIAMLVDFAIKSDS